MRCRIAQAGALPITSIRLHMNGGTLVEPPTLRGVQTLALDAGELANREDRECSWRIAWDDERSASTAFTAHQFKFMSHYADEAMRLIVEQVFDPRFETDDVSRIRREAVAQHARDARDATTPCARWKHRGAAPLRPGRPRRSKRSTQRHRGLRERHVSGGAVYRDDSKSQRVRARRETLRALAKSGRAAIDADAIDEDGADGSNPTLVVVPVEHAAQTKISIALEVPGYVEWQGNTEAYVLSILLDREGRELRESLGVTYGMDFAVEHVGKRSLLVARTKVEPPATRTAVEMLEGVLRTVATQPIDAGEAEFAKRTAMWGYAQTSHAVGDATWRQIGNMREKRQIGFEKERVRHVASLRASEIEEAAKSMLTRPSVIVVVGPVGPEIDELAKKLGRSIVRYTAEALNE